MFFIAFLVVIFALSGYATCVMIGCLPDVIDSWQRWDGLGMFISILAPYLFLSSGYFLYKTIQTVMILQSLGLM